jgi:predicted Zn-dependent peptidase
VVFSAAGSVDHDAICELAEGHLQLSAESNGAAPAGADGGERSFRFYEKDTEQYHVCFGGPGISRSDDRRFALTLLDSSFGGSVSSRLFREIREKRGLAYSVGSYTEQFMDDGAIAMYVGTRADNVAEACEIIGRELAKVHADGLDPDELARSKEHVKARMVLGLESTTARMSRCARSELFGVELLSIDELLARIEAVTADDIAALADELYDPERLSAACIGPDEDRFKSAVGSVSAGLAA